MLPNTYKDASHYFHSGQAIKAELLCQQTLRQNPNHLESLMLLSAIYINSQRFDNARVLLKKGLKEYPQESELYDMLGVIMLKQAMYDQANDYFKEALRLNPYLPDSFHHFGMSLYKQEAYKEAIVTLNNGLRLSPQDVSMLHTLALCHHAIKEYEKTKRVLYHILDIEPGDVRAMYNLAVLCNDLGLFEEGIVYLKKILSIKPKHAKAFATLAQSYRSLGQYKNAEKNYLKAIALDPNNDKAHFNLGVLHLLQGNYDKGWPEYDWRRLLMPIPVLESLPNARYWCGEPLANKTILLYEEQGFGDSIMYIRYAKPLHKMGTRVMVRCRPAMAPLFSAQDYIDEVITPDEFRDRFAKSDLSIDFYCALPSLPYVMKTRLETIPNETPYLMMGSDSEIPLLDDHQFRVGIVWSGNPMHARDEWRSMSLEHFKPLFNLPCVSWFSLQLGSAKSELKAIQSGQCPIDLSPYIKDFSDTAALIKHLDLVVSVDTSVAHLAAAMGKPTWILLPAVNDWRWLLERDDSPWYPTVTLFRQSKLGQWQEVMDRVESVLTTKRVDE